MCSSTTAERQSLASRDRTCCLRRCLPARPLRYYGFRGSIAHPTQSLCTLRTRRRRRPRNTRYRAPATAYPDRSLTGRTTPAFLAHKQSIAVIRRVDCFVRQRRIESFDSNVKQRIHLRILAAGGARGLRFVVPQKREQGMPDARCTRGLACKRQNENRTRAYRAAEAIRHSLRNGFTAYFALSPEYRAFLPPSPHGNRHSGPVGLSHLR